METDIAPSLAVDLADKRCGVEVLTGVLEGRWTTLVIRELLGGPRRFGEIRTALGTPSAKTLTDRLRSLEADGVVTRTVHAEVPPRVVYELTAIGRSLEPVLAAMAAWGEEYQASRRS